jgi:small subunit ribosomal protein S16
MIHGAWGPARGNAGASSPGRITKTTVATKIKLQRLGKMREPHYRIVVADARTKRDGRVIESIGQYHPKSDPSVIRVDGDRVGHWLSVGAQPTGPVLAILKVTGDWQKFKGLPAPEPMKVAAPKADKREVFQAAARAAAGASDKPATTPKKAKKSASAEAGESATADSSTASGQ